MSLGVCRDNDGRRLEQVAYQNLPTFIDARGTRQHDLGEKPPELMRRQVVTEDVERVLGYTSGEDRQVVAAADLLENLTQPWRQDAFWVK